MFWMLVRKELRSCWPFALVALLANGWMAISLAVDFESRMLRGLDLFHRWSWGIYDEERLHSWVAAVAILLGVALALWQSVPESQSGVAAFLAHVARRRWRVVLAKVLSAVLLYAVSTWLPLILAMQVVVNSQAPDYPELWSHTLFIWVLLGCALTVYLGFLGACLRASTWSEGPRAVAGLVAVGLGALVAGASPWFGLAIGALIVTDVLALLWALAGFAAREF
ncbi:MAG: hypothetical protein HYY16_09560 [Planctomycetes bacterium]|nr:hypothetical protein [Planctomycetota bacterium]